MRLKVFRQFFALALTALPLVGCASASRNAVPAYEQLSTEDDDAYCQGGGKVKVGSPDYVYCRKERDAARNTEVAKADRKQRDLADYMLNHPDHPSQ